MDYVIEKMNKDNALDYAKVNALAWKESYKGIVKDDFLELINSEDEVNKARDNLIEKIDDGSRRFLIKYNNEYVGILRVRITKYEKYNDYGELGALYLLNSAKKKGLGKILFERGINELKDMGYTKFIIGCLKDNPSNDFYVHMGAKLVGTNPFNLKNGQELLENIYTCGDEDE